MLPQKKHRIERWLGSQATHFLHSVRQSKCPPQSVCRQKNMINLAKNNMLLDFNCFRDLNRKGEFGTQIQTVRNDLHDKSSENLNNWDATLNSKNMQECHCQELTHWYWEIWGISYYHLVMTNSLPWKIPMLLRTVNHLFRLGPSIPWLCLLVITRGYFTKSSVLFGR